MAHTALALDLERMTRLFHALSDETRLRIVLKLTRGERCVCELQDAVGAYQSRLSFHLKKLKDAGVVTDRRDGRWVYYTLEPQALRAVHSFVAGVESDAVESDAVSPRAMSPDAVESDAVSPRAMSPDAVPSDAAKPDAAKPDAAKPDAAKPDAAKPDAPKPDAVTPDAVTPDAVTPEAVAAGVSVVGMSWQSGGRCCG